MTQARHVRGRRAPSAGRWLAAGATAICTMVLAGGAWAQAPRLARGEPIPPADLERLVDGAVADAMAVEHVAGVSVAVVQGGRTVLLKGYGVSGLGPGRTVDPSRTLFRIGSISKTFTWIALMREVERGRVRLDAPVNDYLPVELRIPNQGFERPIRIVDLMSHASGFEDIKLGHLFIDRPARIPPAARYLADHRPDRVREPGELASYSNYGAALAGHIVARLNGLDYESLVERDVLRPLGMARTTFREPRPPRAGLPAPMPQALADNLATGFFWGSSGFKPFGVEYVGQTAAAGAASSTAADMARYMRMQLAGGALEGMRIYGPRTAQAFRTPILAVPEGVNGWAHGYMVRPLPGGLRGYGHGGSLQTFFSNMVLAPDLDLGVFVTTNTSTGRGVVERLPGLIVQAFYAPSPAVLRKPTPIADGDRYAGTYFATRRAYSGPEKFVDLLTKADEVSVAPQGYLVTNIGSQVQAWVADGAPGRFRAADGGQALNFVLGRDGRAVSFLGARGTFTLERAGPALDPRLFQAAAALALAAALATWIGFFTRRGRGGEPTPWQRRADLLSLGTASFWLTAFVAFGLWFAHVDDPTIVYRWPGPAVLTAAWAAFAAALGSLAMAMVAPLTLWGAGGWSLGRKGRHALAALVFVLFSGLVALRGGLTPWAA
ncbi:serine hydrolase domain-containing protein [Phenylobacterium sp.]|uniref:serine hydrolase domain-containing protein n=1 Tax=Phenylobacterium sp. TaxID=1871053 RepID=UPI002FC9AD63